MEEANQPRVPVEPSEEELRAMLEDRELKQAGDWNRLKRLATRVILVLVAIGALVFFGSGLHKDLAAVMFPEALPSAASKVPVTPPVSAASPAESGGGKLIDQDDIRFTMQLMNFMQGPAKDEARPAADEEPKDGK